MYTFDKITLLITHYNRSNSLAKLLQSFQDLSVKFEDIVVSDDGSNAEHLQELEILKNSFHFKLITTPVNKGLGNNINKGQDAVKTPLTLYIQEDFVPREAFIDKLKIASEMMQNDKELDLVRFYAYFKYPNLKPVAHGFSQMIFNHAHIWEGYRKFYLYSDHPHLRRSNFFEKFGRYPEGIKPDRTEYKMMLQVLNVGAKAYFYEDFKGLIEQENSAHEPSTVKRNFLRNNNSIVFSLLRDLYRYLRLNIELLFYKIKGKN
ncbi:MAG: glycosyltransferase [Pelobium sp.]